MERFMQYFMLRILAACVFFGSISSVYADSDKEKNVENLSPELRRLLQQEMTAIEKAMTEILRANASGKNQEVARLAKQIKDSFILKNNLSKNQKHELHTMLPEDFIKQDEAFNYNTGMLEHVAENGKEELVGFYYQRLFDACYSCHKEHARHKFTSFTEKAKQMSHSH